jgi:hypothetical protein
VKPRAEQQPELGSFLVLAVVTPEGWAQKPFCDDALTAFVSAAPESTDIGKWCLAELFPSRLQLT